MAASFLFAYGSLVDPASARQTLLRDVEALGPARLRGWRRRWTVARDNLASEKTFASADGALPAFCLGLSLEPAAGDQGANGVLLPLADEELSRLDLREVRYRRVDVSGAEDVELPYGARVYAYLARPEHHAADPPPGSVVIGTYLATVEAAFARLGVDQLELYRETTDRPPVDVVEATLVRDRIPAGNPRDW